MKTAGKRVAIAALMTLVAPAISAETFEILTPPDSLGSEYAFVIRKGVVAGSYFSPFGNLAFIFSRRDGYTTFTVPGADFVSGSQPTGLDAFGNVYGFLNEPNGGARSFVRRRNGQIETFAVDLPDVQYTVINDTNVWGASIGTYAVFNGESLQTQGFFRSPFGKVVTFRFPGATTTVPWTLNDLGEMAGYAGLAGAPPTHPFVRSPSGAWRTFDVPAGCELPVPFTLFLNNAGTVAGQCQVPPANFRAYVRKRNGQLTAFDVPGASSTSVAGIAANGDVAGTYIDATGSHGYIRTAAAQFTTFDAPSAQPGTTGITGISTGGDVVGTFFDAAGAMRLFVRYQD